MPEYRRIKVKGGTYFFTVVTYGRLPILTTEQVRAALREGIQEIRQSLPFTIEAWVLCLTIFILSGPYRKMMIILPLVGRLLKEV